MTFSLVCGEGDEQGVGLVVLRGGWCGVDVVWKVVITDSVI